MANWTTNTIMLWAGTKVTDHGRSPLQQETNRIGADKRMHDGTLRRQNINLKRTWTVSWENLPSTNSVTGGYKTADGGMAGEDIEDFYRSTPGKFRLVLKRGSASGLSVPSGASSAGVSFEDDNFYGADVMFTEFSKEVTKRGAVDFWNVSVTMEEV
jgi:hypothetical protein